MTRLKVAPQLMKFVEHEVLPGTGITPSHFWSGFDDIVGKFVPRNEALLRKRDDLQQAIDMWHMDGTAKSSEAHASFLRRIGYLLPSQAPRPITTEHVDLEIASLAGPQLVCPADNARFLLNAANARWGSLLDAVYSSNALLPPPPAGPYDAARGERVYAAVHALLDELFPLAGGRWAQVRNVEVHGARLTAELGESASVWGGMPPSSRIGLRTPSQLVGYTDGDGGDTRRSVLLARNGLHVELVVDDHGERAGRPSSLHDVRLESALSTICDFEDAACIVDADDKVNAYRNWLGLMRRQLTCEVGGKAAGEPTRRALNGPRVWRSPDGSHDVTLPGQALLLARNVGMHMMTDVVTKRGAPIPEHLLDTLLTAACALHDVRGAHGSAANSRHGSIYIVKPKMHGPEEVQLAVDLFGAVERVLGLPARTLKMGVMDEERRTSANLAATLAPAAERLVFVNTGFLDRTADELHTSMRAGPMARKSAHKHAPWYLAYEALNVQTSVACGLVGRGQIGKGMWAEPDDLRGMMATKGAQLEAGATTGWVPSPTAATLHALHYMRTNVPHVQAQLAATLAAERERQPSHEPTREPQLANLLTPPVLEASEAARLRANPDEVSAELDECAQSVLGYVVRWVGRGIGCSKVPNLAGKPLMEDRATLRISSQLLGNWQLYGLVSESQVVDALRRAAPLVDAQNASEHGYTPISPTFDGPEWHAAVELIAVAVHAPNGYTEPTLTKWRRARKAIDAQAERAWEAADEAAVPHRLHDGEAAVLGDVAAYAVWAKGRGGTPVADVAAVAASTRAEPAMAEAAP